MSEGESLRKLDSKVSTAIRRGQIITKLSDVVRELVDNAVDAGPTRVQVLLDNYGLDKIEVLDDGHGIRASELRFAATGGYTSKLNDEQNLSCGEDYGFRGEALSSICSFANVTILTKTEKDAYGTRYILDEAGRIKGENRTAFTRGTNVTVRDLFVKYPVRRNYIREKPRMIAELKEIESYLKSLALSNPKICVVLIHNGSSIWSKPAVMSLEQAICTVLGVNISKQLRKWGPLDIVTPGKNGSDFITTMELHAPKLPIDTKLMTCSSNKSCIVLLNRRRVHIKEFEKMLQQHIMGAVQSPTQASYAKFPVVLLKIEAPPDQVDFNRDMDKAKVFLLHKTEVLETLEQQLKEFYGMAITANTNVMKENVQNVINITDPKPSDAGIVTKPPGCRTFDPSYSTPTLTTVRSQNVASFLGDILSPSNENFSRSPVKTPMMPAANSSLTGPSSLPGNRNTPPVEPSSANSSGYASLADLTSVHTTNPKSSSNDLSLDKDWVLGRMKDKHGNIIESTTLVRPRMSSLGGKSSNSRSMSPELGRAGSETHQTLSSLNLSGSAYKEPSLYSTPRSAEEKYYDLFTKIRNCNSLSRSSSTSSSVNKYPAYEPPAKRSRSSIIFSPSSESKDDDDIFPRRQSQTSQPRAPRQVTLDSLRNWKVPGSKFAKTNSVQSTPMHHNLSREDLNNSRRPSDEPTIVCQPQMPDSMKAVLHKRKETACTTSRKSKEFIPLQRMVSSVGMLKVRVTPSQNENLTNNRIALNKVIGTLRGTSLYVVKLEHLMGVFSPHNLLEMVPSLKTKLGIPVDSESNDYPLSNASVKILINEFTSLSCEEYSEEMVTKIFTVLRDLEGEVEPEREIHPEEVEDQLEHEHETESII